MRPFPCARQPQSPFSFFCTIRAFLKSQMRPLRDIPLISRICLLARELQNKHQLPQSQGPMLVKKYMEATDVYFHSDIQGAAHCIIKSTNNKAPEATINEAAQFAAVFSKAWALGIAAVDVYSVAPEQVSKSAKSGEYLSKGAFAISGNREWYKKMKLELGVGVRKEKDSYVIISGPVSATEKHSIAFVRIAQDSMDRNELAKQIKAALEKKIEKSGALGLDEINSMLPGGGNIA